MLPGGLEGGTQDILPRQMLIMWWYRLLWSPLTALAPFYGMYDFTDSTAEQRDVVNKYEYCHLRSIDAECLAHEMAGIGRAETTYELEWPGRAAVRRFDFSIDERVPSTIAVFEYVFRASRGHVGNLIHQQGISEKNTVVFFRNRLFGAETCRARLA